MYRVVRTTQLPNTSPSQSSRAAGAAANFVLAQHVESWRTRDGHPVGIQSTLISEAALASADNDATSEPGGVALYDLLEGMVADGDEKRIFEHDAALDLWRAIRDDIERKLGFAMEPELFSNMLFTAAAGGASVIPDGLVQHLLATFRDRHLKGLHHFFLRPRFAGDIDCTAVAARARLVTGDIDVKTVKGREALAMINDRILGSAAVSTVDAANNRTHGKDNGALVRNVFKVYLDDHELQDASADRGLKNNPVVVANALYPVLFELAVGLRSTDDVIGLKEFPAGSSEPRTGNAKVGEIVDANVAYVMEHLRSGAFREGCRYYRSPDIFLAFLSESVREFPEAFDGFAARAAITEAVEQRRSAATADLARSPDTPLNLALRAIAAANVGADASPEIARLCALQSEHGGFRPAGSLFTFGSSAVPIHFSSAVVTAGFAIRALEGPRPRLTATGRSGVQAAVDTASSRSKTD